MPFELPDVDRGQPAVIMFQSFAVRSLQNRMWINPDPADDQVNLQPYFPNNVRMLIQDESDEWVWTGNVLDVRSGVLVAGQNLLRIEAGRIDRGLNHGAVDDFVVDNVVFTHQTAK